MKNYYEPEKKYPTYYNPEEETLGKSQAEINTPGADVKKEVSQVNNSFNYSPSSNVTPVSSSSSYTDPKAFQTAINQMRTKMQSNNKLINAKNAVFKHMYDQPLTDEEKSALTPVLAHAISTGNRSMIDAAISDVNQQIKGYNSTIDTNLAAYSTAVSQANALKQDIGKSVLDYTSKGVDANTIAGYVTSMGLNPEQFGFTGSISIPESSRLAYVNNNPGNLKYVGQSGATMGEGGFARFETPEAGFSALQQQIQLDSSRGQTLQQFISKYAPPTENDTNLYIQQAMQATGANINTPISEIDSTKLAQFMAQKESGTRMSYATPQPAGSSTAGSQLVDGQDIMDLKAVSLPGVSNDVASEALALVQGRKLLSTISMRSGYRDKVFNAAQQIDPNFSEVTNNARAKYYQNWVAGTAPVQNRNAINAAVGHLVTLKDLGEKLQNKKFGGFFGIGTKTYNKVKNMLDNESGDPEVKQFDSALNKVAAEIAKVYKGGASPTEQEIMDEKQTLSNYLSESQINGVVDTSLELLSSKIGATADDFKAVMGRDMPFDLIQESARKKLENIGYSVDNRGIITPGEKSSNSTGSTYKGYNLPY